MVIVRVISWGAFNPIIPLALVGYELIIAHCSASFVFYHLISNKRKWNNYADEEQSALEIRTDFFFFMEVANCNASCYWLHVHCRQW